MDLGGHGRARTGIGHIVRNVDAPQHQPRREERQRVDEDRERRGDELDQPAGETGPDERGRRLAQRDFRIRLDEPAPARHPREQHLIGGTADHVLDAAEESDDEQDLDRQRAEVRGNGDGKQRHAAPDGRGDHDRKLADAVDQHARVQAHKRERKRLERDQHAHLPRRSLQQHGGRERQREIRDLGAERRDRQRRPELHELRIAPEALEGPLRIFVVAYSW